MRASRDDRIHHLRNDEDSPPVAQINPLRDLLWPGALIHPLRELKTMIDHHTD